MVFVTTDIAASIWVKIMINCDTLYYHSDTVRMCAATSEILSKSYTEYQYFIISTNFLIMRLFVNVVEILTRKLWSGYDTNFNTITWRARKKQKDTETGDEPEHKTIETTHCRRRIRTWNLKFLAAGHSDLQWPSINSGQLSAKNDKSFVTLQSYGSWESLLSFQAIENCSHSQRNARFQHPMAISTSHVITRFQSIKANSMNP